MNTIQYLLRWNIVVMLLLGITVSRVASLDFSYHNQNQLEIFLHNASFYYPDITDLYSIGKSVHGVNLWVLAIGKDIKSHVPLRPNVKYIGNIHGNEAVSREMMMHFIDYLLRSYGSNQTVTNFLNNTAVHVMVTMNPDGFNKSILGMCDGYIGRDNANGFDLNRNFPDFFKENKSPVQLETHAVIEWIHNQSFVLSANFHGGAMVANYPFDSYNSTSQTSGASISPDDDVFQHLALTYTRSHASMSLSPVTCPGDHFVNGITNGASWYTIIGGMQDYNYLSVGCMEITIEMACCKFPYPSQLPQFWQKNKDALFNFLTRVHIGAKGFVTDENNNPLPSARVCVVGREPVHFRTSKYGEYWRLLLPGSYTLQAEANGYLTTTVSIVVHDGVITRQDIKLMKSGFSKGFFNHAVHLPLLLLSLIMIFL
ncbi:hypothetical protein CHS0354_014557 [Potamilus streckersoni]|uniref:Peptidase M14 domain-containing protein n=1 Tax=Potamilus streckersoni TaxID=2493646 RepID=A0AAE0RQV2_9BIVA|nr:hypothetical protein CHS0354_014557 [Potamilus streckersoni]